MNTLSMKPSRDGSTQFVHVWTLFRGPQTFFHWTPHGQRLKVGIDAPVAVAYAVEAHYRTDRLVVGKGNAGLLCAHVMRCPDQKASLKTCLLGVVEAVETLLARYWDLQAPARDLDAYARYWAQQTAVPRRLETRYKTGNWNDRAVTLVDVLNVYLGSDGCWVATPTGEGPDLEVTAALKHMVTDLTPLVVAELVCLRVFTAYKPGHTYLSMDLDGVVPRLHARHYAHDSDRLRLYKPLIASANDALLVLLRALAQLDRNKKTADLTAASSLGRVKSFLRKSRRQSRHDALIVDQEPLDDDRDDDDDRFYVPDDALIQL